MVIVLNSTANFLYHNQSGDAALPFIFLSNTTKRSTEIQTKSLNSNYS